MNAPLQAARMPAAAAFAALLCAAGLTACDGDDPGEDSSAADARTPELGHPAPTECQAPDHEEPPDYLQAIGCRMDFDLLASEPLHAAIPGARSVKVVLDQEDGDALYFQNSNKYQIHHKFAEAHLSGDGKPFVSTLAEFNRTEYTSPDRRFVLGAVTHYEGPDVFTFELATNDNATPEMIAKIFRAVRDAAYFGGELKFHPTSETIEAEGDALPGEIEVITTDELYEGIDYQPLNLATGVGRLRFVTAEELASIYLSFSDLVVLDRVPNDISVVAGMITEEFQTPLAHVNVLAQNRKSPNMGLRNATRNETLRALEGKWVKLVVGAFDWTIDEIGSEEAQEFLAENGPEPIELPAPDMTVTDLRDLEEIVVQGDGQSLREAIVAALPAWGGKAAHFSVMAQEPSIPMPKAFGVPVYYYVRFMEENGFYALVDDWLADPEFIDDPAVRDTRLAELRDLFMEAPVDETLQALLLTKLTEYPELRMRFRTSTNSEDLQGFPCAGCYESHTGVRSDWEDVLDAIRETWASIWLFRTFEERSYYKVDHTEVTMALLVHHSFPSEEANGVALTANPFDPSELVPGHYVNVQFGGDYEVVHPPPGVTSDEFIYSYTMIGLPISYLSHSNVLPEGQKTVLTPSQIHDLSKALAKIHELFSPAYGPASGNHGWYAMDVEFKFDGDSPATAALSVKQARPHPGRGK
jgi:hypothetical protein